VCVCVCVCANGKIPELMEGTVLKRLDLRTPEGVRVLNRAVDSGVTINVYETEHSDY
jgi:hypothetical protein